MLVNLWGFVQSFFVSGTTERVPIDFVAELSPWSGATAWVEVGIPAQEFKLAFDFSEGLTRLWTDCPLFVEGGCMTTRFGNMFHSVSYMESITLPNQDRAETTFFRVGTGPLFHSDYRETLRNRDVAGYIGVGRTSVLFSGKVISVSRDSGNVRFKELDVIPAETQFFERSVPDPTFRVDSDSWFFRSRMGKNDLAVTFDLASHNIVIPHRMKEKLVSSIPGSGQRFWYRDDERIFAICSRDMFFELRVADHTLRVSYGLEEVSEFPGWCATRFVVRRNVSTLVVGQSLLNAVDALVFDFQLKRFGFLRSERTMQSLSAVLPTPFNPIVSVDHRLDEHALVFDRTRNLVDGFILTRTDSVYMSELDGELGGSLNCWSLERISWQTESDANPTLVDIPGSFDSMELVVDDQSARFELTNYDPTVLTKPMRAVITHHQNQMFVCWIETARYTIANPSPVERIETSGDGECPICHEAYQEGDMVQSLNDCNHKFHLHCISEWLSHLEHGCPMCRCPVPKVRRTREPTIQPIQEYLEPQDDDVSCIVS